MILGPRLKSEGRLVGSSGRCSLVHRPEGQEEQEHLGQNHHAAAPDCGRSTIVVGHTTHPNHQDGGDGQRCGEADAGSSDACIGAEHGEKFSFELGRGHGGSSVMHMHRGFTKCRNVSCTL